jgi:hypothetical protein
MGVHAAAALRLLGAVTGAGVVGAVIVAGAVVGGVIGELLGSGLRARAVVLSEGGQHL